MGDFRDEFKRGKTDDDDENVSLVKTKTRLAGFHRILRDIYILDMQNRLC